MTFLTKQPWPLSSGTCRILFIRESTVQRTRPQSRWRSQYAIVNPVSDVTPPPIRVASSAGAVAPSPPLSILPLSNIIRSLLTTGISSTPLLLRPAMSVLSYLAHSQSPVFNPDRNPVLRYLLKKTFYTQFCAGQTREEVQTTLKGLKDLGYKGVILCYAKEAVQSEATGNGGNNATMGSAIETHEVDFWKNGTMETVRLTGEGDFVALKFTGAGQKALDHLQRAIPPSPILEQAINAVCDLAAQRNVRLLFDAEHQAVQPGIDAWTIAFQQRYNRFPGKAVIYGTYQAYLRSAPTVLARHLSTARRHGFTLGVKLVRGAYLGSDPRHLIWSKKEDTDKTFDEIAQSLIKKGYNKVLAVLHDEKDTEFPDVNFVLASHNHTSVKKAQILRNKQFQNGEERIDMVYGQLLGMADELSCELLQDGRPVPQDDEQGMLVSAAVDVPKVYKYLVWGTVGECMKYLLRRAEENRDAVARTKESRRALSAELGRRIKAIVRRS